MIINFFIHMYILYNLSIHSIEKSYTLVFFWFSTDWTAIQIDINNCFSLFFLWYILLSVCLLSELVLIVYPVHMGYSTLGFPIKCVCMYYICRLCQLLFELCIWVKIYLALQLFILFVPHSNHANNLTKYFFLIIRSLSWYLLQTHHFDN